MKIVADNAITWLDELFSPHGEIIRYSGRNLDPKLLKSADALLIRSTLKVDRALLEGTSVKFVASATVGCDHVDQSALKKLGITFRHAPGCNANSVAEYVIAAIAWHDKNNKISIAKNQTAAVLGCGGIGAIVKNKLERLGFKVLVNDPPLQLLNKDHTKTWQFVNLDQALKADVICLHTPLILAGDYPTMHLIGVKQLELINPKALLINAGRGEVINNAALNDKLKCSERLNVVLDVWENEPEINRELLNKVNLATAHLAGHSYKGKLMGSVMIYQHAVKYFNWPKQIIEKSRFSSPLADFTYHEGLHLYDVVAKCYDIEHETHLFRAAINDASKSVAAKQFDMIRKNYLNRPEFEDLHCQCCDSLMKKLLGNLGFSVK